ARDDLSSCRRVSLSTFRLARKPLNVLTDIAGCVWLITGFQALSSRFHLHGTAPPLAPSSTPPLWSHSDGPAELVLDGAATFTDGRGGRLSARGTTWFLSAPCGARYSAKAMDGARGHL